ncbi:MAG TPA: peroxiredoxin [Acidobacteriaceae bacterium]|nr:peroxiredoxin [Acidobacteriaceae bacterium]
MMRLLEVPVRTIRTAALAVLVVFGLGFGLTVHSVAADAAVPQVGEKAPAFALPSQDSPSISLDSFRGKWVVLYFYPKDMSQGCTIEAHNFQQDMGQYDALNAVIVGVSVDSADSHKEFCAKEGLHFKLLSDQDKKVSAEYGSLSDHNGMQMSTRNTFLIDPQGKIVKVWTAVNPNAHSQEVLAALRGFESKS